LYANSFCAEAIRKDGSGDCKGHTPAIRDAQKTASLVPTKDLVLDNRLILELKAAKALADEHVAQVLGYLHASRVEHDLLMNFGAPNFEIRKYALIPVGQASRPGGPTGAMLSVFASLALFRGLFYRGF
jgi:hypothetical protein